MAVLNSGLGPHRRRRYVPDVAPAVPTATPADAGEDVDYGKLRQAELAELAKARGLDPEGKVDELRARLEAADKNTTDAADAAADTTKE